jgi:hypothetical protein
MSSITADRGWFTKYTPFRTHVEVECLGGIKKAIGCAEVELSFQLRPPGAEYYVKYDSDPNNHITRCLHNVLHVPGNGYNILGGETMGAYACDRIIGALGTQT